MAQETNQLTRKIIKFIFENGGFAWRQNSGGVYDPGNKFFRTSPKKGVSDILCVWRGHFVAIEIKTGSDSIRPEQEGFLKSVEHCGGITMIVGTYEEFMDQFKDKLLTAQPIRTLSTA